MRNISQLHPKLQPKIQVLIAECKKQGLIIGIGECLRTVEEQNALYAKGRTAPGSIVTNAKGSTYSSMHQWGVAVDFYRNDGKGAFNDSDGFFTKVGKIGQSIGLEWGGAWKSIKDKPHFQLADWGSTTSKLKKMYGTPEKFMATWSKAVATTPTVQTVSKTDNPYPIPEETIRKGSIGTGAKWVQYQLNKKGYSLIVDGNFGNKSVNALISFQRKNNLTPDGVCGVMTKAKLK